MSKQKKLKDAGVIDDDQNYPTTEDTKAAMSERLRSLLSQIDDVDTLSNDVKAKTLAEIGSAKRYKAMRDELRLQRETSEAELRRLVANRKKALS
eukprot:m.75114 g.75114  ORF g.75114 m.75114 type:complete len:95 (+) comp24737_c1_seq2:147-431(+)